MPYEIRNITANEIPITNSISQGRNYLLNLSISRFLIASNSASDTILPFTMYAIS